MSTRVFRNADGILAVERDGVLVFGPSKVFRAADVTIDPRPDEHWIALPDAEWSRPLNVPQFLAEIGGLRLERLLKGGRAVVFTAPSAQTDATVRTALAAHRTPKDGPTLARDRLQAWRASGAAVSRDQVVDLLILMENR